MPAATHNFFIEQGSNFTIVFEYFDSNGNLQDLSQYCIRLRLRADNGQLLAYSSQVACTSYSLGISNTRLGTIEWTLPSSTTQDFKFDTALYDLDINTLDSSTRLATGIIQIIKNNFPECPNTSDICKPCESITCEQSISAVTPTPTPSPSVGSPQSTSTVTVTPTNTSTEVFEDLCDTLCRDIDLFAKLYSYDNTININDLSSTTGIINVSETGIVTNVEVNIAGLYHSNPQDLVMILYHPIGTGILLSAYNKINQYSAISGVNYTFSNRAMPGVYLNNKSSADPYVNILDKTSIYNTDEDLSSSLFSVTGISPSGDWSLVIHDNDLGSSGVLNNWNLILTYEPPIYNEDI